MTQITKDLNVEAARTEESTREEKIKDEPFDLIVLDVNLPDGSGFDLCKKIKAMQEVASEIGLG